MSKRTKNNLSIQGSKKPKKTRNYVDVNLFHWCIAVMMGTNFQTDYTHELVATKKPVGRRISITFRYIAAKTRIETEYIDSNMFVFAHIKTDMGFQDVYEDVKGNLEPDITRMFGKVYNNNGRMVADMVLPSQHPFTYKYSGKTVVGQTATQTVMKMFDLLKENGHGSYNWAHIVYYPNGQTKLGAHSDDEHEIQKGFPILGISLFANEDDTRILRLRPKNECTNPCNVFYMGTSL